MNIAYIENDIVVSITVADEEWLKANQNDYPDKSFVVIKDGIFPTIGTAYDINIGFDESWKNPTLGADTSIDHDLENAIEEALSGE